MAIGNWAKFGFAMTLAMTFACSPPPLRPATQDSLDATGNPKPPVSGGGTTGTTPGTGNVGEPPIGEPVVGVPPLVGEGPIGEPPMGGEPVEPGEEPKQSLLFVSGGSPEIRVYKFDKTNGSATLLKTTTIQGQATFLAVHPETKMVFGANEGGNTALAFSLDTASGALAATGSAPTSGGPAHVSVHPNGKLVFAADYGAGVVTSYNVNGQTLSVKTKQSPGKKAHAATLDPAAKNLFVPCLGDNTIAQFAVDSAGALKAGPVLSLPGGKGPRHLTFHPNGKFAFLMNEFGGSVQSLSYDGSSLKILGNPVASTNSLVANTGAEIQIHPNGKFLYSSNRGDDSIAIYKVSESGTVTLQKTVKTGGRVPRHFAIDPSGKWMTVANQGTGNVTIFQIDAETGELTSKPSTIDYTSAQYAEIFDFY